MTDQATPRSKASLTARATRTIAFLASVGVACSSGPSTEPTGTTSEAETDVCPRLHRCINPPPPPHNIAGYIGCYTDDTTTDPPKRGGGGGGACSGGGGGGACSGGGGGYEDGDEGDLVRRHHVKGASGVGAKPMKP